MIACLRGVLLELSDSNALMDVSGVGYDVYIPPYTHGVLSARVGSEVILFTYHYILGGNIGNGFPTLIGFITKCDKEFFEKLITVSGIGPKAGAKALTFAPADVASAIEREDVKLLRSMPGVGERTAREIIVKLKGKVSQFVNISINEIMTDVNRLEPSSVPPVQALEQEAIAILEQLGYRTAEADRMVQEVLARQPAVCRVEELIQLVYRQVIGANRHES